MTTSTATRVALRHEVFAPKEEVALAGFLAGYSGLTREAYMLDLRQYVAGAQNDARAVRCAPRTSKRSGATSKRRASSRDDLASALHHRVLLPLRRTRRLHREVTSGACPPPELDYESHATGLDRNEVGAMLVAAGLGSAQDHALLSLLALNGLRVSEATGANIEALGLERGHRTLTILRKGGKTVIVPLAPRTARPSTSRSVNAARDQCSSGPTGSASTVTPRPGSSAHRPQSGIPKRVGPHTLRHAFITAALDAGVPLRDVQEAASHADPAPPCATTEPESRSTATPPTSSPPSSPEPPARQPSRNATLNAPERAICARGEAERGGARERPSCTLGEGGADGSFELRGSVEGR